MTSFFVVLAYLQRIAEARVLLDLGVCELVNLVHFEIARSRRVWRRGSLRTAPIAVVVEAIIIVVLGLVHLLEKLFAQGVALGVNFVFIDPEVTTP